MRSSALLVVGNVRVCYWERPPWMCCSILPLEYVLQPVHACMKVASVLEFCGFVSAVSGALIQKRDTLMGRLALYCSTCQFCTVTTIIILISAADASIYLQAHMRKRYRSGLDHAHGSNVNTSVLFFAGNCRETLIETN